MEANCSPRLFILPCLWAVLFLTVFFAFPSLADVYPTPLNVSHVFGVWSDISIDDVDVFGVWSNISEVNSTSTNSRSSRSRSLLFDKADDNSEESNRVMFDTAYGNSEESNRVTGTSSRVSRRSGPHNAPPNLRPSPSPPFVDSKNNPRPSSTLQRPPNFESFPPPSSHFRSPPNSEKYSWPPPYSQSLSSPPNASAKNPARNSSEIPSTLNVSRENPTPPDNNFKTSSSSPNDNVQKRPPGDRGGVYVHMKFNLPNYNIAGEGWMSWNPSAKQVTGILVTMIAISFAFHHILTSLWDWCYKFFLRQKNTEGIPNPPINTQR